MKNQVSIPALVSEMSNDINNFKIDVPTAKGVDVQKLIDGDKSPMFVTLEVANEGVSGNHRRYSREVIKSITKQINDSKPEAYEGHVKEEDRGTSRPKPVTLWIGAIAKEVQGKLRIFAKGYVMPYAKELKQYLSAAKASSKKIAVSVYGQAKAVWDNLEKVYDLSEFSLESVDWARPGAEGLPGLGFFHLASEMKGDVIMNREELIKDLKAGELEEFNSKLVSEMREATRKDIEFNIEKRIKRENVNKMSVVSEQLGTEDPKKAVSVISEMRSELQALRRSEADHTIDDVLIDKIPNKSARKIIRPMIISEMKNNYTKDNAVSVTDKVLKSDETKTIIKEMTTVTRLIRPIVNNKSQKKVNKFTTN